MDGPQSNVTAFRGKLGLDYSVEGTTHMVLEPLDFIARLASLVPKPRVNLIRYQSLFPHYVLVHASME